MAWNKIKKNVNWKIVMDMSSFSSHASLVRIIEPRQKFNFNEPFVNRALYYRTLMIWRSRNEKHVTQNLPKHSNFLGARATGMKASSIFLHGTERKNNVQRKHNEIQTKAKFMNGTQQHDTVQYGWATTKKKKKFNKINILPWNWRKT